MINFINRGKTGEIRLPHAKCNYSCRKVSRGIFRRSRYFGSDVEVLTTSQAKLPEVAGVIGLSLNYVLIKGAGDLASAVACTLVRAGFRVVMTEIPQPTCVRRKVAFAEAVYTGETVVAGVRGRLVNDFMTALKLADGGEVAVIVDPEGRILKEYRPLIFIDAAMIKENRGTKITDADIVIALGPGFDAGSDVHAVIETHRGRDLGKPIYNGKALENTGVPGEVLGHTSDRLLRAPVAGVFTAMAAIGDRVTKGDVVGHVDGMPVKAMLDGTLRGLLKSGLKVEKGMKLGDIHPAYDPDVCVTLTDKALAVAGGVLEAISFLQQQNATDFDSGKGEIFREILEANERGLECICYTLVAVEKGTALRVGSRLLVIADGRVYGTLGHNTLDNRMIRGSVDQGQSMIKPGVITVDVSEDNDVRYRVKLMVEHFLPREKLIIFGGGHIARPLVEMAAILGYHTVVIDDRPEFANRERFPKADEVICAGFEDVLGDGQLREKIDRSTSIVIVTHGHKYDQLCLEQVIDTEARYIGMIGSVNKVRKSFRMLLERGVNREVLKRIAAPIGLELGGKKPEEIALSIMSQIVARKYGGSGRPLQEVVGVGLDE